MHPSNNTTRREPSRISSKSTPYTTQGHRGPSKTVQDWRISKNRTQSHRYKGNSSKGNALMWNGHIHEEKGSNYKLVARTINLTMPGNSHQSELESTPPSLNNHADHHEAKPYSKYPNNPERTAAHISSREAGASTSKRIIKALEVCIGNQRLAINNLEKSKSHTEAYRTEINNIIECLNQQELPDLHLDRHDQHWLDSNQEYDKKEMGTLERMMNLLEPIQQGSIKVNSHAVQIYRTLSTKPIHIVKNVHILLSEFRNCALEAKHTTASILIFRGLFLEMCARNPYSQLLFGKGRTEFLNDLLYLDKSRYASQYLYLTLGHICQEHETHDLYFNLDAMRDDDEANCAFEFHFAFQRTDHTQNDLVWMRSSPLERKLSGSRNTRISNSFGPFCPGRLAQNSGLEMEIGEGFVIQQTWINTGQSTDQRPQMQLSSFLKDYQTRGPRLRLARLISEAVLRLDPSLWQRGGLESENVIVIAPLKYGRVDSLQSHIQVSLERHNTEHNGNCQQRQAQASTILSSLGLILLELAKAESILRPESEGCIVPLSDEEFNSVEHEMGIYYAVAVRFCLSYHPPDDNLYDVEVQRNFYERVVHGLRLQETEEDEAMAPAYEALALQGCLPT